jgi:gamma-glutamyltranspeptidase/glutathione hydrolase
VGEAVAGGAGFDDVAVEGESVDDRGAESGVGEGFGPVPGQRVCNPVLAQTYQRIVAQAGSAGQDRQSQIDAAHKAFYMGFVAEAIDRFMATSEVIDATGRRGLLNGEDLAAWKPGIEQPATFDYRGYTVHKPGPRSQGPVFLQQLGLLENFDLAAMGANSSEYLHAVVEAAKLAFADREAWYGDPEHTDVPLAALLDRGYADDRRSLIGTEASGVLRPGLPHGRVAWTPPVLDRTTLPSSAVRHRYTAVVQLTPSSGDTCCDCHRFRRKHGGRHAEWRLAEEFTCRTRARVPARHPRTNCLARRWPQQFPRPGKRPRTTLSPTLVVRDDRPYLAFGTPGGDQQDQWTLGFFLNHVEFGMGL